MGTSDWAAGGAGFGSAPFSRPSDTHLAPEWLIRTWQSLQDHISPELFHEIGVQTERYMQRRGIEVTPYNAPPISEVYPELTAAVRHELHQLYLRLNDAQSRPHSQPDADLLDIYGQLRHMADSVQWQLQNSGYIRKLDAFGNPDDPHFAARANRQYTGTVDVTGLFDETSQNPEVRARMLERQSMPRRRTPPPPHYQIDPVTKEQGIDQLLNLGFWGLVVAAVVAYFRADLIQPVLDAASPYLDMISGWL